jgi:hypothetical protein
MLNSMEAQSTRLRDTRTQDIVETIIITITIEEITTTIPNITRRILDLLKIDLRTGTGTINTTITEEEEDGAGRKRTIETEGIINSDLEETKMISGIIYANRCTILNSLSPPSLR